MNATRTILLTGSSGVVGSALLNHLGLNHLGQHRIVCLTHNTVPDRALERVQGDLTAAGLGLDLRTRRRLIGEVDAIVHCAAVTEFTAGAEATRDLNVLGTQRVLDFAAEAGATTHYVSTAFVAREDLTRPDVGEGAADPSRYLESKRNAETMVRDSGLPATIIRPSVVIGDSASGAISRFQGLHSLVKAIMKNALPVLPLHPLAHIDFIPQDLLAGAVARLIDNEITSGEYWITSGQNALTAGAVVGLCLRVGLRHRMEIKPPRLVDLELVDRLIRPVFIDPLPSASRRRFDDMLAMTSLFTEGGYFPSSLDQIPGCAIPSKQLLISSFCRNVEHLVRTNQLGQFGVEAA